MRPAGATGIVWLPVVSRPFVAKSAFGGISKEWEWVGRTDAAAQRGNLFLGGSWQTGGGSGRGRRRGRTLEEGAEEEVSPMFRSAEPSEQQSFPPACLAKSQLNYMSGDGRR